MFLIDRWRLRSLQANLGPGRSLADEVAVSGFECEPCVMEVEQGEAGGASALDAASSIPLRVVAGMPVALGLDPLGDLESVRELEHDLLLLW